MHTLLSENWMIADEKKQALISMLASIIQGNQTQQAEEMPKAQIASMDQQAETVRWFDVNSPDIPEGSVLVIPVRGMIMKYSYWSLGTQDHIQLIKLANENSKIKSILLVVDSGGGQVTNTDRLAEVVAKSKKPVMAFVEGMAASAAYYIIAGCKRIIASSNIDRIGSIGTMFSYIDAIPYYESIGFKVHEFNATKSTDKNKITDEVLAGKYDNYRKLVLDPMNEAFHSFVNSSRKVDQAALTGKVYFAPEAQQLGLIDEIGSIEYAIETALNYVEPDPEEFQEEKEATKTDTNMKIKFLAAWAAALAFFGLEQKEQEVEVTPEMMEKVNDQLQKNTDTIAALQSEKESLTQKVNDLTTAAEAHANEISTRDQQIASQKTELDTLKAEVATLKGQPAATTAAPTQDPKETGAAAGEGKAIVAEDKSFLENLNAVAEEYGVGKVNQ